MTKKKSPGANPIAKSLRNPSLRPKVISAKKGKGSYKRQEQKKESF